MTADRQPAAVGIDLGTSNSVVAVIDRDGAPRILTTEEGSTMMPSIVWFSSDGPVVGERALPALDHSPDLAIFAAKRLLGRRFDHPEIRKLARVTPYQLVEAPNGDTWVQLSAGRTVSPEEVNALILRELRRMAERHFGRRVERAVITIPAWYDTAQRQATKDAAAIAGLPPVRLLSEPTAAALGHGAHRGDNRRYLVCDLGGDDIDRVLVENLVRDVRATRGIDVSTDAVAIERLRVAAQRAKHELSSAQISRLSIPELAQLPSGKGVEYTRPIRREELEQWSTPLVQRLELPVRETIQRSGRRRAEADEVLLVGGMTRMPAIRRELARVTGREPSVLRNPEEVVAVGAALEVARLEGVIEGVLLVDVAARGLMLSAPGGGECETVVSRSSVIPTREHRVLMTRQDDQARLEFDVWEGESADPGHNRHLGRYAVIDLPPAPAGDVLVMLEITIDTDGTARLGATELISGERLTLEQMFHAGLARADVARLARQIGDAA